MHPYGVLLLLVKAFISRVGGFGPLPVCALDDSTISGPSCGYSLRLFLKYVVTTAARGTGAPKRTVLKKNLLTTLHAINPAGSCPKVIGARGPARSMYSDPMVHSLPRAPGIGPPTPWPDHLYIKKLMY